MNIGLSITKNEKKFFKLTEKLRKNFPEFNFIHLKNEQSIIDNIENINILLCYGIPKEIFKKNISLLKWIQLGNAGVDNCMFDQVIKSKIIITNSRGINSKSVSEYVMSTILFFEKNLTECIQFKKNRNWVQWEIAKKNDTLENKIIGIIGYGAIGKEIAKRAKSFNMKIYATRRLQKKKISNSNVDLLLPMEETNYILKNSDYIVLSCPLTPKTYKLINKKNIKNIKKDSIIINISRGDVIDEKSLIVALQKNKIRGAALDVFSKEPLDKKNPLFDLKNVLLSPHISGNFKGYQLNVINAFEKNLELFVNNKSLKNRICKKRLY